MLNREICKRCTDERTRGFTDMKLGEYRLCWISCPVERTMITYMAEIPEDCIYKVEQVVSMDENVEGGIIEHIVGT